MRYRVFHRTTYTYNDDVRDSLGVYHMTPRPLPWQDVATTAASVDPEPVDLDRDTDVYGNAVTYFQVTAKHRRLQIEANSDVTVRAPQYDPQALARPWETSRPHGSAASDAWLATEFALESARAVHAEGVFAYAAASLLPGRPVGEAADDLMHRIFRDFRYDSTATTVTSSVAHVLEQRAGVCQDFAHLALACLRSHGVAARYVSGYLATQPPPGKERVFGADASHAWLAVWLPEQDAWLAIDPTNDQRANDRYVTVAWGRDYADVSPMRGIIFTDATSSTLRVSVDVAPWQEAATRSL
ncbi:transglutaminase family protein [Microbacterium mangrovi]|nr:transglutaminase family protein [Microbacterium mangrovi]